MKDISDGQGNFFGAIEKQIPKAEDRGPVFQVGEKLFLKSGYFRVKCFGRKSITLQSIPLPPGERCQLCAESKRMKFTFCSHCGRDLAFYQ